MESDSYKKRKWIKYCFVPECRTNSAKFPDKIFVLVPYDPEARERWLKAANRFDVPSPKTTLRCCEDHFDMENDFENWMRYNLMGGNLLLKKDTVPHKFECQELAAKQTPNSKKENLDVVVKMEEGLEEPHYMNGEDTGCWKPEDGLHEEISLPISPSGIKQESEYEDDSPTEHKVDDNEILINKLKEEIAELKNENQQLTEENHELASENQRLSDENQSLNERNQNITSGIDQLLQKSQVQRTNYVQENDIISFDEERTNLNNTILALNKESRKLFKTVQEVTEQKQRLTDRVKEFQQRIQELKHNIKTAEKTENQQIQNLNKKLLELNQENHELNERNLELNRKLDDVNLKVESLEFRNKSLTDTLEGNRGRKTANFKELAKIRCLTEENESLHEKVKELKDKLCAANREKRKKLKAKRKLV